MHQIILSLPFCNGKLLPVSKSAESNSSRFFAASSSMKTRFRKWNRYFTLILGALSIILKNRRSPNPKITPLSRLKASSCIFSYFLFAFRLSVSANIYALYVFWNFFLSFLPSFIHFFVFFYPPSYALNFIVHLFLISLLHLD